MQALIYGAEKEQLDTLRIINGCDVPIIKEACLKMENSGMNRVLNKSLATEAIDIRNNL